MTVSAPAKESALLKLNIGSGGCSIPGFQNIDRKLGIEAFPLSQYPTGCVEEIRASHILEHFSVSDAMRALAEWFRVLKPGGRIRISVPDIHKAVTMPGQMKQFVLMGGQNDPDDFHKSAYDQEILEAFLNKAGFEGMQPWESDGLDSSSHEASLNIEAFKPNANVDVITRAEPPRTINVKAITSIPRIGWNDCWGCIHEALRPFGIPVARFNGVFWGQCMQRAFEEAIEQGVDYVLTIDYDSMFTSEDVRRLLQHIQDHPEIEAIAPVQMRRGSEYPLVTIKGEKRMELSSQPVQVTTAHFGLTLISMNAVKQLPKPWFKSEPSAKGEWDDDRLDDDIWFWHIWKNAGKKLYLAPDVSIGHLEVMVSEFDEQGQGLHTYVGDWWKRQGKAK